MRIWFDTEFIEDGHTIDLISIGAVREDGLSFYAENMNCRLDRASPWVQANVLPHLRGGAWRLWPWEIRDALRNFAGEKPEFWAYYGAYDWVALCQLFGTMMELPTGWPMYVRDVKQLAVMKGDPRLPRQTSTSHHALDDAHWTREAWRFLQDQPFTQEVR